ncbi:hypothetical protein [Bacillus thuringiensis]|uniref:hypothetical protein n=1 Tax=Bacillus thuringiensis TaxID=1428 RepID=UPI000BA1D02E|nr:hypothetical protein [Bacillus thuringiensis]
MCQLNNTKDFKEDNEFWREVYYYMEEHNCYKDEAIEVVKARKQFDLQGKTVNEVFDEILDIITEKGVKK